MTTPSQLREDRKPATMIRKLQSNRVVLGGLLNCYGTFRFTGGDQ